MENLEEIKKELFALITKNNFNKVFERLENLFFKNGIEPSILVGIKSEFHQYKSDDLKGIAKEDFNGQRNNVIRHKLIEIIASLQVDNDSEKLGISYVDILPNQSFEAFLNYDQKQTIKKMYELIVRLEFAYEGYLGYGKEEKLKESYFEAYQFFKINEIMFTKDISEIIQEVISQIKGSWVDYSIYRNFYGGLNPFPKDTELIRERAKFYKNAIEINRNILPKLKEDLKNKFRKLLGIKELKS